MSATLAFENPDIEGFKPVTTSRVIGFDYLTLLGPNDVQLELSVPGSQIAADQSDVSDLLGRMGEFIAEHDGYRSTRAVNKAEPSRVIRVASIEPRLNGEIHLASVYCPHAAPQTVIKAYDECRSSAAIQFRMGTLIEHGLHETGSAIHSPAQIAMFTAAGYDQHRTVVMERLNGTNLPDTLDQAYRLKLIDNDGYHQAIDVVKARVKAGLKQAFGSDLSGIVNDLDVITNIIIDGDITSVDSIDELEIGVIDQPVSTIRARMLFKWMKLAAKVKSAKIYTI